MSSVGACSRFSNRGIVWSVRRRRYMCLYNLVAWQGPGAVYAIGRRVVRPFHVIVLRVMVGGVFWGVIVCLVRGFYGVAFWGPTVGSVLVVVVRRLLFWAVRSGVYAFSCLPNVVDSGGFV